MRIRFSPATDAARRGGGLGLAWLGTTHASARSVGPTHTHTHSLADHRRGGSRRDGLAFHSIVRSGDRVSPPPALHKKTFTTLFLRTKAGLCLASTFSTALANSNPTGGGTPWSWTNFTSSEIAPHLLRLTPLPERAQGRVQL